MNYERGASGEQQTSFKAKQRVSCMKKISRVAAGDEQENRRRATVTRAGKSRRRAANADRRPPPAARRRRRRHNKRTADVNRLFALLFLLFIRLVACRTARRRYGGTLADDDVAIERRPPQ